MALSASHVMFSQPCAMLWKTASLSCSKLAAERPNVARMFTMSGNSVTAMFPLPIFGRRLDKVGEWSFPDRCALMLVVRCFTVTCCQRCDFFRLAFTMLERVPFFTTGSIAGSRHRGECRYASHWFIGASYIAKSPIHCLVCCFVRHRGLIHNDSRTVFDHFR